MADKELLVREKQELQTDAEQTRPGVVFTPAVDIFESDKEISVLADMPGVASDGVTIDLHNDELKITGEVDPQGSENETYLLREYESGRFHRHFSLSDRIDQNKISASMKDGVLRLVLPKVEKAKPRKIEVTSA
ncbi:MAG: Hsp20/alpha crystallin family protein [Deltaproteobacteria bacterium]|nr:MAG: Hsp20/alpha crystallin family protein [Deltaproteobacteria bacterium]